MLGSHIGELAPQMPVNPKSGRLSVYHVQNGRNSTVHSLAFAKVEGSVAKSGAQSGGVARQHETFENYKTRQSAVANHVMGNYYI